MKTKFFLLISLIFSIHFCFSQIMESEFRPCIGGDTAGMGISNYRLLSAKSADGSTWIKTNIVLSDRSSVSDGIILPSGRILIYYVAGCEIVNDNEQMTNSIKVAVSDDNGESWIYRNVLFDFVPIGGTLPVDPNVIILPDGTINMLVTIDPDMSGQDKPCTYSAISEDGGFTFEIQGQVFAISGQELLDPENFRLNDSIWYLWTGGIPGMNRLGVSIDDGLSFIDQGNFCSDTTANPSQCYVTADILKYVDTIYKMYAFGDVGGGIDGIVSLTSADCADWTLDSVILELTTPSNIENSRVWAPTVIKLPDSTFLMVYETVIPSNWSDTLNLLTVLPNDTLISIGDTLKFTTLGSYTDDTKRDLTSFATWNSSDPSVATIDNIGRLVAVGTGTAKITAEDNGIISDSITVTVSETTGLTLDQKDELIILNVYPNPTKDYTKIKYQLLNNVNNGEIIFYNTFGREVKRLKVSNASDYLIISTYDLPAGTYYYRLRTGKGLSNSKKMMVIK
ncbi:MAG: Ig-like domain-containing protein [Bacteroidetes bacterium]|nr:Ig-like domain-containing protein [Bacteroidota bacterium]